MNDLSKNDLIKPPTFFQRYQKLLWIALIAAAVIVAGVLVYLLFFRANKPQVREEVDAKVSISAPERSASGSEIAYEINIENLTGANLTEVTLEVFYPRDFTFVDSTPNSVDAEGRQFQYATLVPRQKKKIVIVGRLDGSVAEVKTVSAKLLYVPENFRSTFTAEAQAQTTILAPDITLQVKAPGQLVSGQYITYNVEVNNVAAKDFQDVVVRLTYPEKFVFKNAVPAQAKSDAQGATPDREWKLAQLAAGQSVKISIDGLLSDDPGTESLVQVELFFKDANGALESVAHSFAFTQILISPLEISQKVTRGSDKLTIPADFDYEVTYENRGEIGLHNVVISVVFETPIYSSLKIQSEDGQIKGSAVVWIPAAKSDLLVVTPGAKGTLKFHVTVPEKIITDLVKNPRLATRVEFKSQELAEPISGNTLEYKLGTTLDLSATTVVTVGSNPPVAGEATTYEVTLLVKNTVNDVTDAELVATIPGANTTVQEDTITPNEERPQVTVTAATGVLRWHLGEIFAFSGAFHEPRRLQFKLTYTSPATDSGSVAALLKDIQVTGTDDFTGEKISSNKIEELSAR